MHEPDDWYWTVEDAPRTGDGLVLRARLFVDGKEWADLRTHRYALATTQREAEHALGLA